MQGNHRLLFQINSSEQEIEGKLIKWTLSVLPYKRKWKRRYYRGEPSPGPSQTGANTGTIRHLRVGDFSGDHFNFTSPGGDFCRGKLNEPSPLLCCIFLVDNFYIIILIRLMDISFIKSGEYFLNK